MKKTLIVLSISIVILNINGYFNDMLRMMEHATDKKFITKDCVELFKIELTFFISSSIFIM